MLRDKELEKSVKYIKAFQVNKNRQRKVFLDRSRNLNFYCIVLCICD